METPDDTTDAAETLRLRDLIGRHREVLLGAPLQDDEAAPLETLLSRSRARLEAMALAATLKSRGIRDEAAADLFQTAWAGRVQTILAPEGPEVRDSEHFFAIMAQVFRRLLSDERRSERRRADRERAAPSDRPEPADPDLLTDLDEAVARLPEDERAVLMLRDVENLSRRATAERLSMTEDRVRKCRDRAIDRLRRDLAAYKA